ncbi:MAG: aminomethyl-transferring glycine dehydrogenase subunit GcvPA [Bryobacterales bacterium]|nr:aminomethyl-transferring glycine dehydrogenase subunit GcvPA [Bryobacteraceae bacterium]MDW8131742.1 aminomethyl-transferring glycine dehydrogenase subunit GcvPA [Bryobacterales bacterium]
MRFLPKSDAERRRMLEALGLESLEQLFAQIPPELRLEEPLPLGPGLSEFEVLEFLQACGRRNVVGRPCFLGAGAYFHYRPAVIEALASRGEFLTAYTPYQAEISQGLLTAIFEFQTLICQLTGMDVANASMYDGSTAMAEAAFMARRITGREHVVVAASVHPEYREVLRTYARNQAIRIREAPYDPETGRVDTGRLAALLDADTAALVVQSPNFFGVIEPLPLAAEAAHSAGALLIHVFTEAVALALLKPCEQADIVAGELQSFALPPSYGGPYAGVIATRERFVRQLPGRLVGQTTDTRGQRAFCLTLATREQHIRREKATSNICTNQALVALMATIFMALYGKQGLRELAEQNLAKAHYVAGRLERRFSGPFFNEFVARCGGRPPEQINRDLAARGIIGGLPLGRFYPELADAMLLCATETSRREDMDRLIEVFGAGEQP